MEPSVQAPREPPEARGVHRTLQGPSRGEKGRSGGIFGTILNPHKTRNTSSCSMEMTTVTQNSEGGRFRKSAQRNLPEQKTRRRGRGKEGAGEGGKQGGA